jgi:hypothetical protein
MGFNLSGNYCWMCDPQSSLHYKEVFLMKVPLRRRLKLFPKLHRRLSSVRWTLLLITTAMFFLSAASAGCPTGGYTLMISPTGPSVQNPQPPNNPPPSTDPPPPSTDPPPPQPTANLPGITPIVIPTIPGSPTVGSPPAGSPIANPPGNAKAGGKNAKAGGKNAKAGGN